MDLSAISKSRTQSLRLHNKITERKKMLWIALALITALIISDAIYR